MGCEVKGEREKKYPPNEREKAEKCRQGGTKRESFWKSSSRVRESGEREENTMVKTERRKKIWSEMLPTKISRLPDSLICFLACAGGGREGCVKYAGKKLRSELFTF